MLRLYQSTLTTSEVNKDTVTEQSEHDKVDGRPHAVLNATLRANPIVHYLIPVLTSQNLQAIKRHGIIRNNYIAHIKNTPNGR